MIRRRAYGRRGGKLTLAGIKNFFVNKVDPFLRQHKVVSKVAHALGNMGVPYGSVIGDLASSFGYGYRKRRVRRRCACTPRRRSYPKKKRHLGVGALYLPGGALRRTRRIHGLTRAVL